MVDEQDYEDAAGEPRDADGGGDPGGLPGGRIPAPPIPRDEWVSQVVDDPSSGTQPVLLQGYVGDAADESRTRIYLDASLGTYVDVANDDVLHHQPLRGDHEPAGGTMVWVRGDAQVSPGTGGGAAAAGGDFFAGPVLEQNRKAGMGGAAQPAAQVHITLLTVGGCNTRWFICPPQRTLATLCTHQIICSRVCQDPLGGMGIPPWKGGPGGLDIDATMGCRVSVGSDCPTLPKPCGGFELPTDQWQPHGPLHRAAAVGPTGYQGCGQATHLIGCTGYQGCGQATHLIGCTGYQGCGQATHLIGCTGYQGCGQPTHLIGCTGYQGCGQATHVLGCTGATAVTVCYCGPGPVSMHPGCPSPQIGAEQAAGPIGHTGWQGCGQATHVPGCTGATAVTVCYCGPGPVSMHPGCPSPQIGAEQAAGPIGHTGWLGCQPTKLIGCTGYLGCGQPHISLPGCIRTGSCPQAEAVTGPGSTIATVCTQIGCITAPQHCIPTLPPGCPSTAATVCTQVGCPQTDNYPTTYRPWCGAEAGGHEGGGVGGTSVATVCSQVGCPPHAALGAEQGAAGIATGQYAPQCPTFGFTCTYVHCPPMAIETRGLSCPTVTPGCTYVHCPPRAATVVTQGLGCPQSVSCPPETIATRGFGCPPTSTCPPTGGYGCPRTSTCPPTYAPGCGGGGVEAAAAAPYTYHQGCPTFGFTCTQFC